MDIDFIYRREVRECGYGFYEIRLIFGIICKRVLVLKYQIHTEYLE